MNAMLLTDGYKLDHRRQYPKGTEYVYSNWTPRSNEYFPQAKDGVVVFGIQYFIKKYLIEYFNKEFFDVDEDVAVKKFKRRIDTFLGENEVGTEHIRALHKLGYLPIKIKALPEGSVCPIRVPMLTIVNTHPDFFWITNFLETLMSCELWLPMTSATTARVYRKELERHAEKTGFSKDIELGFLCHDFSMRGMAGLEASITSGMGHLTSFIGSETIPAVDAIEEYYNVDAEKELVSGTVPACYSDDTEVLTNKGWKLFKDLDKTELIAQYNSLGNITFVKPTEYFADRYKGKMISITQSCKRPKIDILVTPNHNMIVKSNGGKISCVEANEYKKGNIYTENKKLIVSGTTENTSAKRLSAINKLKIAFQADGSFPSHKEDYNGKINGGYPIRFSLKKERKKDRLIQILKEANIEYYLNKHKNGYYSFWVISPEKMTKDFSWVDLSNIGIVEAQDFILELQYWDGKVTNNSICYSSVNKSCVDVVQSIGVICGYTGMVNSYTDKRKDHNRKDIYNITLTEIKNRGLSSLSCNEVDYDGYVYCVTVPTHMLIVRRNGKVIVCGNTEHSVMCAGGIEDEFGTFKRLLTELYPQGYVSIVSDTWDLFKVVTDYVPRLKQEILARDGRLVIRPDSGNPVNIICGYTNEELDYTFNEINDAEKKGVYELLWDIFGGTINEKGYKVLDPHIGVIYGDSITIERQAEIYKRLEDKGFAATNLVLGIGSYTYQYRTRDSLGFAMKATWCQINGEPKEIFKQPKTDSGMKNSLKGLIQVLQDDNGKYYAKDCVIKEEEQSGCLETIFEDGKLVKETTLKEIRSRLANV